MDIVIVSDKLVALTSKLTTQLGVILTSKNDHLINSFGISIISRFINI
ncbi:hypothetical protein [Psychromonas sp. L1A2]|nr:hypothetical protein [Psychromonas sp. L1A2]